MSSILALMLKIIIAPRGIQLLACALGTNISPLIYPASVFPFALLAPS